jgi:hypothetical protein
MKQERKFEKEVRKQGNGKHGGGKHGEGNGGGKHGKD